MNSPRLLSIVLLVLLIFTQSTAWGADPQRIVLTDQVQMILGNAFMAEGDYYRAITEYKKLIILFPDSEHLPEALHQTGMAYYRGKDYESAVKCFTKVRQTYDPEFFSSAAFHEGLSYKKLGNLEAADLAFERARTFDNRDPAAANAHLGLALNALEKQDLGRTRVELEHFEVVYPNDERVSGLKQSFHLLDTYQASPKKSPGLAGTMSAIIPGSGQMYAGHYRDGLMAFVVNGLFIAGTIAAIDDENYALAGIVGGVGLPFYLGNIYGAANAARKWNLSLTRQLRDELALALNYHF